jgi:hypothetical protein
MLLSGSATGGFHPSAYSVPAGYVTIVSDICVYENDAWYKEVFGITIASMVGVGWIFRVSQPYARAQKMYHWRGHQVLEPGDGLSLNLGATESWIYRVSGYELTLP